MWILLKFGFQKKRILITRSTIFWSCVLLVGTLTNLSYKCSLAFQVLYPSARDSGVLLPDVEADQGPQVPGVGLGDDPGAGQALQVRSRVLGHQKCLPGKDMDWFFLNSTPCMHDSKRRNIFYYSVFSSGICFLCECAWLWIFLVKVASGGMDDPAVSVLGILYPYNIWLVFL